MRTALSAAFLAAILAAPFAFAQTPAPVETAPLAPPSATITQPGTPPAQSAPPPLQAAPAQTSRPTLVPESGDAGDVNEVTLPAKPAAMLSSTSSADESFTNVRRAIQKVEGELRKAGIAPAGRPIAVFEQFNPDNSLRFDVMVPVERAPEGSSPLASDIRFGTTPAGKALRFVHKGPYEDADSTYDMIEIYLEAKGITVKDAIIEEFVNDPKDASDPDLELNIFVQPK